MLRAAVIGFGGMGHNHARQYASRADVQLAAIADVRPEQFSVKSMEMNIGAQGGVDMSGVETFTNADTMLKKIKPELVSVCLPTDLHSKYAIKALKSGAHVLCEKPMARKLSECDAMIRAKEKSGRHLMIAQCLRFWPCYEKLSEIHRSGELGKLLMLSMRRISICPRWAFEDWFYDGARSGGALLDMHIHDTDFANYLLGVPAAVQTQGFPGETGAIDNALTQYLYEGGPVVTAETSWSHSGPFNMSFLAIFEGGSVEMGYKDGVFRLYRKGKKEGETVELTPGTGYEREVAYFTDCIATGREPGRCMPFSTRETMRIAFAEEKSALAGGKRIAL